MSLTDPTSNGSATRKPRKRVDEGLTEAERAVRHAKRSEAARRRQVAYWAQRDKAARSAQTAKARATQAQIRELQTRVRASAEAAPGGEPGSVRAAPDTQGPPRDPRDPRAAQPSAAMDALRAIAERCALARDDGDEAIPLADVEPHLALVRSAPPAEPPAPDDPAFE